MIFKILMSIGLAAGYYYILDARYLEGSTGYYTQQIVYVTCAISMGLNFLERQLNERS